MEDALIYHTPSSYAYPLLIKNILNAPLVNNPEQEIVYRGEKRFTYRTMRRSALGPDAR